MLAEFNIITRVEMYAYHYHCIQRTAAHVQVNQRMICLQLMYAMASSPANDALANIEKEHGAAERQRQESLAAFIKP